MKNIYFFLIVIISISCNKYQDQTKPDVDNQLTRKYCNDPAAINYNDSFPGIPDNSTCIYAQDYFLGVWEMVDSVFKPDSSFLTVNSRDIVFSSVTDSTRKKMKVTNFSTCSSPILITANNYKSAYVDNLMEYDTGQVICSDTITGYFEVNDSNADEMRMILTTKSSLGINFHKAKATKK